METLLAYLTTVERELSAHCALIAERWHVDPDNLPPVTPASLQVIRDSQTATLDIMAACGVYQSWVYNVAQKICPEWWSLSPEDQQAVVEHGSREWGIYHSPLVEDSPPENPFAFLGRIMLEVAAIHRVVEACDRFIRAAGVAHDGNPVFDAWLLAAAQGGVPGVTPAKEQIEAARGRLTLAMHDPIFKKKWYSHRYQFRRRLGEIAGTEGQVIARGDANAKEPERKGSVSVMPEIVRAAIERVEETAFRGTAYGVWVALRREVGKWVAKWLEPLPSDEAFDTERDRVWHEWRKKYFREYKRWRKQNPIRPKADFDAAFSLLSKAPEGVAVDYSTIPGYDSNSDDRPAYGWGYSVRQLPPYKVAGGIQPPSVRFVPRLDMHAARQALQSELSTAPDDTSLLRVLAGTEGYAVYAAREGITENAAYQRVFKLRARLRKAYERTKRGR